MLVYLIPSWYHDIAAIFPPIDLPERICLSFGCSCEFGDTFCFDKICRGLYVLYIVSVNTLKPVDQ